MDYLTIKDRLIWSFLFIGILLILASFLNGYTLNPNISESYTGFYNVNLTYAAIGLIFLMIFNLTIISDRITKALGLSTLQKGFVFFGFSALIISLTVFGGQIVGVPQANIEGFSLTQGDELLTSSFIPGFVEDGLYLIAIPTLVLALFILSFEGLGAEIGASMIIVFILISSIIGGTVFTSAHVQTYGELQEAYLGAWIFGTGQSLVYQLTGWYMPVTHIAHNAWIAMGKLYGINVGAFAIVG